MSAFAVILHDPQSAAAKGFGDIESNNRIVRARIEELFKASHYKLSDYVYFVSGPRLVSSVADSLGLSSDEGKIGAVVSLNGSFSGYSWPELWDWLRTADRP